MATIGNPFNLGSNADSSVPPALHIPTEVCESIIDMLYSNDLEPTLRHIATLHSCALVCRAWRVRSQKILFYKIQLSNSKSFHKLAILDARLHLRDYISEVELTGYHLHTTTSIFALFPAVFARKMPNLDRIDVVHLSEVSTPLFPRKLDPPKFKSLPYIPLHPCFGVFLSSFTQVLVLCLGFTTFRSYTEFVRLLHGLPKLEELNCNFVGWTTTGGSHPHGANLTRQPDWAAGRSVIPPFAPKLQRLLVRSLIIFVSVSHGHEHVSSSMAWTNMGSTD